jgi:hypothetical protein
MEDCPWLLEGVEPHMVSNRLKETEDRLNRSSRVVCNDDQDNEVDDRVDVEEANALLRVAMGMYNGD